MRLACLMFLILIYPATAADLTIVPIGEQRVLYDWSAQRCDDEFIPDAPARAFRRADGNIALIATHRKNWMMVGRDIASLKPVCASILDSTKEPAGTGSLWIEAVFTRDGKDVAALVSQDLTQIVKDSGCDAQGKPGRCWLNNILAAHSTDMGASFHLLKAPDRVVATLTQKYDARLNARIGVFTTSNIVSKDGAYFMIAYSQGEDGRNAGNCVFRSSDPFDPSLWRAWDGVGYTLDMRVPEGPGCPRIEGLGGEVRSVSYIKKAGVWAAVFASRQKLKGDVEAVPGFYFATSSDLVKWTGLARIMPAPTRPREQNSTHFWLYPSMMDADSFSWNFDTVDGDKAILLFTVSHLEGGRGTMKRDLVYVPLRIN